MPTSPNVSFRASGRLASDLQSRGTPLGAIARRDMERYYEALRRELQTVRLSEAEASLICDVCNGTLFEPHTIPLLWAEIDDAIRLDRVDAKWVTDGGPLVERLRSLSYAQSLAVVDAVERFWQRDDSTPDRLRAVGLFTPS